MLIIIKIFHRWLIAVISGVTEGTIAYFVVDEPRCIDQRGPPWSIFSMVIILEARGIISAGRAKKAHLTCHRYITQSQHPLVVEPISFQFCNPKPGETIS